MRWLLATLLCMAIALGGRAAHAAPPVSGGDPVERIVVRGTRWIEEAAVLAKVRTQPGDEINADAVQRDLKAVFGTGFFDDVVVRVEEGSEPGKMLLVFEVVEKPAVVNVRLEGNKKINDEDLRELIDVKSFGILNEAKVNETVSLIRDKYTEKGFYLAEIEPEIVPFSEGQVEVVFNIVENRKVIIQRIDFTGNTSVPDQRIRKFMRTNRVVLRRGSPVQVATKQSSSKRTNRSFSSSFSRRASSM